MGYFWVSWGQFCLKSWSIRLHVSFPGDQNGPQTRFAEVRARSTLTKKRVPPCVGGRFSKSWPSETQKMPKKRGIIDASTPKCSFFGEKWRISEMSTATGRQAEQNTQTSPTIHPDKLQLTHYVGPPPRRSKKQEDVM